WPRPGDRIIGGSYIKIKAEASDPDGWVSQVTFFAQTNAIGTVTNPPFTLIWAVEPLSERPPWTLTAVAVDNAGAVSESAAVGFVYLSTPPPSPVVEIVSPQDGALFAAPATFVFSAEVLASSGDNGPVEFFVDTNSVGVVNGDDGLTATTPPL